MWFSDKVVLFFFERYVENIILYNLVYIVDKIFFVKEELKFVIYREIRIIVW